MRCTSYGDKERFRLVSFSFLSVYYTIEMLKAVFLVTPTDSKTFGSNSFA